MTSSEGLRLALHNDLDVVSNGSYNFTFERFMAQSAQMSSEITVAGVNCGINEELN